jgi:hypothetical protein
MTFGYARPFSFKLGATPPSQTTPSQTSPVQISPVQILGVRHGVTEITLSDGRLVRATLHVKGIAPNPRQPGSLDISYDVVTETVNWPNVPILDVHETLQ